MDSGQIDGVDCLLKEDNEIVNGSPPSIRILPHSSSHCDLKAKKRFECFPLGKLPEKLNAHFSKIKILANDPQLLENVQPSMSFNVVHGLKMRGY